MYTLGASASPLDGDGLGAPRLFRRAFAKARAAGAGSIPTPVTRTITTRIAKIPPEVVGQLVARAARLRPPPPSTKVYPLPFAMIEKVRTAAAYADKAPRLVTRPIVVQPPRAPVVIPERLYDESRYRAAAIARARAAGVPPGGSIPTVVTPIERVALAPAPPAPTKALPASSSLSLVNTAPAAPPTPDASAAELEQIKSEVKPSVIAVQKIPPIVFIGGGLALLWLISAGVRGSIRGGKAGW